MKEGLINTSELLDKLRYIVTAEEVKILYSVSYPHGSNITPPKATLFIL